MSRFARYISAALALLAALLVGSPALDAAEPSAPSAAQDKPALSRPATPEGSRASPLRGPAPTIKVTPAAPDGSPSPALRAAYEALRAGDYDTAARLYAELARTDRRNVDVLLGEAALALRRGDLDATRIHYLAVLRLEPDNAVAQGSLLAIFGGADYATAEVRLKALAAREPSAFLYQALGTLYAEQALWPQAQDAYFRAHHLDARNADHAYNLAVSLEHIGQRPLALTYYRRAVDLARGQSATGFDVAQAERRAVQLAGGNGE